VKLSFLFFGLAVLTIAVALVGSSNLRADKASGQETVAVTTDAAENEGHPFAEKCYTCHGEEVSYPEWEQSGHAQALVNLLQGKYPVKDSCLSCHSAGYEMLRNHEWPEDQPYNKDTAINAISCSSCHLHSSPREHYLVKPVKDLCVSCHKMDCGCAGAGVIHQSQTEMFLGRDGVGVQRKPSPHVRAMKNRCVHCHMAKEDAKTVAQHGGHTFKATFANCKECHDDMDTKFKQYREEIEAKMQTVKAMLDNAPDPNSEAYKAAKWNYDMVKGDGGYGLHNIPYARELLDYSLSLKSQLATTEMMDGDPVSGGGE